MQTMIRTLAAGLLAGAASIALAAGGAHAQASGTTTSGTSNTVRPDTDRSNAPPVPGGTTTTGTMTGTTTSDTSNTVRPDTDRSNAPPTSPGSLASNGMQESDVKSMLENRDFSSIEDVRQEGGAWTAKAERDGEAVELRVERATALVGGNLDQDMVRTMLQAEGFDDVSNVEEDGDDWTAEASRDGSDVRLHVIGKESVVITERKG